MTSEPPGVIAGTEFLMAHRDSDVATQAATSDVTVRLVDVEPFAGLAAAAARFSQVLTEEAIAAMPQPAVEALSQMQSILWRLEHSRPET